ncbi:MAG TPA: rhodanese-like domain-containing protein [Anaeromyxobacter sp.]|nr:rhodanese-like domain-containing protein [Anaeromyxobacter sp.]
MTARLLLLAGALALAGCQRLLTSATGARTVEPSSVRAAGEVEAIDLREPAEYEAGHLPGAVNVPVLGLDGYLARTAATPGRPLLLVCAHGKLAALAAPTASLYRDEVLVLAGGMEGWRRAGLAAAAGPSPPPGVDTAIPVRALGPLEQLVACASGCAMKPLYLILAFGVLRLLRRAGSTPLRLLRHGVLWFFVGELLCAANFYLHRPGLLFPIELLHGLGMVAMSALVPWGLWRLLEDRVLHYDDPDHGCAIQRFCGRCWKRDPVRCGLHDLMIPVVIGLAVVALMPLSAPLRPTMFRTEVFGSAADYGEPILNHLVELRLYPVLGALLFLATLPFLLRGGPGSLRRAEPVFYAALGFTLYPALRHLLVNAYRERLHWSDFWEELTELLAMVTLGLLLWIFRGQLGLARRGAEAPAAAAPPGAAAG